MQKKFISNLLLLVTLNLLIKPLAIFGIDAEVQNQVGTKEYGFYFALLNLSYLFNIILDLGINNYTTKNVARYPEIVPGYLGKLIIVKCILFLFYALFTIIFALSIDLPIAAYSILGVLIFNQFLVVFIAYFRSHLTGLLLFKQEAIISVLDKIILIFAVGYILYFSTHQISISEFVYILSASYIITFLVAFTLLIRKIQLPKISWNSKFSFVILRNSFPYALLILLMMFYTRTDSIMIERLLPDGSLQAGYYAQGFRLLDAFFVFAMLFSSLLYPIFSKMLKANENISKILRSGFGILISGAVMVAIMVHFNSESILNLVYTDITQQSILIFQVLMWSFIGMCMVLIYGTLLTVNGNLKVLNILSLFGIILNVILNFYLIPIYGAIGAAFATLFTQSIIAISQYFVAVKKLKISFSLNFLVRFLIFVLLFFTSAYFLNQSQLNIALILLIELTTGIFLILLLKVLDIKNLLAEFKNEVQNEQLQ